MRSYDDDSDGGSKSTGTDERHASGSLKRATWAPGACFCGVGCCR
jgi:hypothetical protein